MMFIKKENVVFYVKILNESLTKDIFVTIFGNICKFLVYSNAETWELAREQNISFENGK